MVAEWNASDTKKCSYCEEVSRSNYGVREHGSVVVVVVGSSGGWRSRRATRGTSGGIHVGVDGDGKRGGFHRED